MKSLDEGHDQVYFKTHVKKMQDAADNVRRMQEVVGDEVNILDELYRRLTPVETVGFPKMIKDYNPIFEEHPIRPKSAGAMARVADRIAVPIAQENDSAPVTTYTLCSHETILVTFALM